MNKQIIISELGSDHTTPVEFLQIEYGQVYGLYTFEGDVFVIKNGTDIPFDSLSKEDKILTVGMFKRGEYKLSESLQ